MKALLLTTSSVSYGRQQTAYHGIGWVAGLHRALEQYTALELAVAFPADRPMPKLHEGRTTYYPLPRSPRRGLRKWWYYWHGYRKAVEERSIVGQVEEVVADFHPDVVHIFGTEADFGYVIDSLQVPCVVHLQGLLGEIYPRFFPPTISAWDFRRTSPWRECVLNNGQAFNHQLMRYTAQREAHFLQQARFVIGRTAWDREVVLAQNPKLRYFKVDEVLRAPFYEAPTWQPRTTKQLVLLSTLSDVAYKGLDLLLQTAQELQRRGVDFRWHVVGVTADSLTARCYGRSGLKASLPMVHYEGVKCAEEVIDMLLQSALYVHPSWIDNSPNSLCEAQYLGVPVVATAVGGVPTLMADDAESLVENLTPSALATAIEQRWHRLQQAGETPTPNLARERHDPCRIARLQEEVYRTILEQNV